MFKELNVVFAAMQTNNETKTVCTSFSLPTDVKTKLYSKAAQINLSVNRLVSILVSAYIESNELIPPYESEGTDVSVVKVRIPTCLNDSIQAAACDITTTREVYSRIICHAMQALD